MLKRVARIQLSRMPNHTPGQIKFRTCNLNCEAALIKKTAVHVLSCSGLPFDCRQRLGNDLHYVEVTLHK